MRTLLRTLTEKSKIGFGRYAHQTVGELLGRNKQYLSWIYFNSSSITFTEEILDKINIWDENRIDKPGKKPEFHNNGVSRVKGTLSDFKTQSNFNKTKKISIKTGMRSRENRWNNKASLAWKNQGH